jgi:hypothetical protein
MDFLTFLIAELRTIQSLQYIEELFEANLCVASYYLIIKDRRVGIYITIGKYTNECRYDTSEQLYAYFKFSLPTAILHHQNLHHTDAARYESAKAFTPYQ